MPLGFCFGCCGTSCGGSPASITVTVTTCTIGRAGVTVTATLSGATTQTGTTDSSGVVTLSLPNAGTWTITATAPSSRFSSSTSSTTVTVVCGGTYSRTLGFSAKTGFHCVTGCWEPLPNTLYYSDACVSTTAITGTVNFWSDAGPGCSLNVSVYIQNISASWVVVTAGSGYWRIAYGAVTGVGGATGVAIESAAHDPADTVDATFTVYDGSGQDLTGTYGIPSPFPAYLTE